MRDLWAKLNDRVFDGSLGYCVIRITRSRKYYGKCVQRESDGGKTLVLLISGPMHSGGSGLSDTLVHEMIHQWQFQVGLKLNEHDETFTQWIPKIKELTGIDLQDTWSNCEGDVG